MTPDDLRALAARVVAEEPTFALECEIRNAVEPDGPTVPRRYLTSHDAAFGAMPAGWRIIKLMEQVEWGFSVEIWKQGCPIIWVRPSVDLPAGLTAPRAVTAAGLMARAAEMEAAHAE